MKIVVTVEPHRTAADPAGLQLVLAQPPADGVKGKPIHRGVLFLPAPAAQAARAALALVAPALGLELEWTGPVQVPVDEPDPVLKRLAGFITKIARGHR